MENIRVITIEDIKRKLEEGLNLHKVFNFYAGCYIRHKKGLRKVSNYGDLYRWVKEQIPEMFVRVNKYDKSVSFPTVQPANSTMNMLEEMIRRVVSEELRKTSFGVPTVIEKETRVIPMRPTRTHICQQCGDMFKGAGGLHRHIAMKHEKRAWQFKKTPEEVAAYMKKLQEARRLKHLFK